MNYNAFKENILGIFIRYLEAEIFSSIHKKLRGKTKMCLKIKYKRKHDVRTFCCVTYVVYKYLQRDFLENNFFSNFNKINASKQEVNITNIENRLLKCPSLRLNTLFAEKPLYREWKQFIS